MLSTCDILQQLQTILVDLDKYSLKDIVPLLIDITKQLHQTQALLIPPPPQQPLDSPEVHSTDTFVIGEDYSIHYKADTADQQEVNDIDLNQDVSENETEELDQDETIFLDKQTKVSTFISRKLLPHQLEGIKFLWENLIVQNSGCILADYMGLGKTVQTVTVLYTFLKSNPKEKILILSPNSVTEHWLREFEKLRQWYDEYFSNPYILFHVDDDFVTIPCTLLTAEKSVRERKSVIENWNQNGGILILSYDLFRIFSSETDYSEILTKSSMVICDEGHKIKNAEARITKSLEYIECSKKLVLTGYPLQNNLFEYYTMLNFVRPNVMGTKAEFNYKFVKPISKALLPNASEDEIRMGKRRAWLLYHTLSPFVLRRDCHLLKKKIPSKKEYLIEVKLTPLQKRMYHSLLQLILNENQTLRGTMVFWAFDVLTMLLNSPAILYKYYISKKKELETQKKKPSIHSNEEDSIESEEEERVEMEQIGEQIQLLDQLFKDYSSDGTLDSAKLILLFDTIQQCKSKQEKLIIFSRSIATLDVIEEYLKNQTEEKQVKFVRFDGSTRQELRTQYIDQFNQTKLNITVFLISTLAGGEGINLCSACKVVLFDINWNPSNDAEAAMRVWRIGQTKEVSIYRYITCSTVEKNVYLKQMKKEQVSQWVIDNRGISLAIEMDYQNLFPFKELDSDINITDSIIQDELLVKQIQQFGKLMYQIREQDLLFDEQEFQISEEEKKLALGEEEYDAVYSFKKKAAKRESPKRKSTSSTTLPKQLELQQQKMAQENEAQQLLSQRLTQLLEASANSSTTLKESTVNDIHPSASRLDRLVDVPTQIVEPVASSSNSSTSNNNQDEKLSHSLLEAEKQSMIHNMERSAKYRELMKQRQQNYENRQRERNRVSWQPPNHSRNNFLADGNAYHSPYQVHHPPYQIYHPPYQNHYYSSQNYSRFPEENVNKKRNASQVFSSHDDHQKKQKF